MAIPFLACMIATAGFYHLPPRVLPSLQAVEGGGVGSEHANAYGSFDLGPMQINTRWVEPIAVALDRDAGSVRAALVAKPCFNVAAAGAILHVMLIETRGDLMRAIGDYHSHTPGRNAAYQLRVKLMARALFETPGAPSHR